MFKVFDQNLSVTCWAALFFMEMKTTGTRLFEKASVLSVQFVDD